ncbi:MAG TPA: hypothetical protein DDZ51_28890 [Planctomycetaceae bacterium]|nr:hypothetical protein [Planctomycetaceae bacterium]
MSGSISHAIESFKSIFALDHTLALRARVSLDPSQTWRHPAMQIVSMDVTFPSQAHYSQPSTLRATKIRWAM